MEISLTDFCLKYKRNNRYMQKLLKENRLDLLPDIKSFRKIGYVYLVTVEEKKVRTKKKVVQA